MRFLVIFLFLQINTLLFAQDDKHSLGVNLLMPNLLQIQYEYQVNDNFRLALGHSPSSIYPNQVERIYTAFSFSLAAAHTLLRTGKSKLNKLLISGGAFYGYDGDASYPSSRFLREGKYIDPYLAPYSVQNDYAFYAGISYDFKIAGNYSAEFFLNWYLLTNAKYLRSNDQMFFIAPFPLPAITIKRNFAKRIKKDKVDY